MKIKFVVYIFFVMHFASGKLYAQFNLPIYQSTDLIISNNTNNTQFIGTGDSVFFDLAAAYQLSSHIEIPVFIRSSSIVNSLDFAIKYDEQRLILESLTVPNSSIQYLFNYNQQDSTLRFTSNSLTPLPNDSILLILGFETFFTPLCSNEFQNVYAWLNGDQCSQYISNCVISEINEISEKPFVEIKPNPSSDFLTISSAVDGIFKLINSSGMEVISQLNFETTKSFQVDVSEMKSGIYFYSFISKNLYASGKVIVLD